jgi:hypothetical protein
VQHCTPWAKVRVSYHGQRFGLQGLLQAILNTIAASSSGPRRRFFPAGLRPGRDDLALRGPASAIPPAPVPRTGSGRRLGRFGIHDGFADS